MQHLMKCFPKADFVHGSVLHMVTWLFV